MGDSDEVDVDWVRSFYRGHAQVGEAVVVLMLLDPPWRVRDQGHGVRVYCPCGTRKHQVSVPHTPDDDRWAARQLERTARRYQKQHVEDPTVDEC